MFLFDVAIDPISASPIGLAVAVAFFLVCIAIAFFVYKMVKRTVKMAFRMVIVAFILLIAIVGSISLWWFFAKNATSERPNRPPVRSTR